jgi:hypothetical protein
MPAPGGQLLSLVQNPYLYLVLSSPIVLKRLMARSKMVILALLSSLGDIHRRFCEFVVKCDENWCRMRAELRAHRLELPNQTGDTTARTEKYRGGEATT